MKKIVIFNVGGALSTYLEIDGQKAMIDLGSSQEFSPIDDFMIPLANEGKFIFSDKDPNKWMVDQLFISHLDEDHISDYPKFRKSFQWNFITCPNDNSNQDEGFKIKRKLIKELTETQELLLNDISHCNTEDPAHPEMSPSNPLIPIIENVMLFYIKPGICENNETLVKDYANNISLVLFVTVENKTILFPGDILTDGMSFLIDNNIMNFKDTISVEGIDYLIAPHHGLETGFSEDLFQTMAGNKVRLNIISEKIREDDSDENRTDVDSRYNNSDYSTGDNSLGKNGVKTSGGHIVIDLETKETEIKRIQDKEELLNEFRD